MANFLILGGNGQIGKYYIEKYIDLEKNNIIILDINSSNQIQHENVYYFNIDVSNAHDYNNLITFLEEKYIEIDCLLFSVGINFQENFFTSSIDNFKKTMSINFLSFYISLKKLYKFLSYSCSIVAIASQNGIVGHEDRIDYSSSKAALIQIVKNLSIDFSKDQSKDIRVNTISPGYIHTENNSEFFNTINGKKLIKRNPYNKIAKLDDICGVIHFLFSNSSYAIRGENLVVDFGYTIV